MIKFDVNINFPILHRDIIKISKVMKEMNSDIRVYKNTDIRVVHGNSEIGMLSLGIENGDTLHFTVMGDYYEIDSNKIKEMFKEISNK